MITADDTRLMDVQQGGLCFFCGRPLGAKATHEHLIPRAYGGADEPGNVVLAHRRCNQRKADDYPTREEVERFIVLRRRSRLGIWPPLLAILEAAPGDEDLAVARAIAGR